MGCQTIHAWPYHGQSKTVERFFGTFAELERLVPGYTGTSIDNKPPRMHRGERLHRKAHEQQFGNRCLSLEEAHTLIAYWFDEYAQRPQRGHLEGKTPLEVFSEGKGPGVDKAELVWLMMNLEIKTIHRNGITFRGQNYSHPALYGRRHKVTIRYDLQDTSSIWILDHQGKLLCEATPVEKLHPAAAQLGSEDDKEKLSQHIALKKNQEKLASVSARALLKEEILPAHRRQMAEIGVLHDCLPATGQKKAEVIRITDKDRANALRESEESSRCQREMEATQLATELENMTEFDRYDRLVEMEMQGFELTGEWRRFMRVYEQMPEYGRDLDFWEGRRTSLAILYGQKAAVAGESVAGA